MRGQQQRRQTMNITDTITNNTGTTATIVPPRTHRQGYMLYVNCAFINQFDSYIEACCARWEFLNAE